jgi:hypothetical protein
MRRGFAFIAVVGVFLACSDLKRAEDEPNVGGDGGADASSGEDGGGPSAVDADVGPPPVDFECSEPWTKEPKTAPECAPRTVREINDGVVEMRDISIARTPAGRVAIAFHAAQSPDEGEMHFLHFVPATASFAPEKLVQTGNAVGAQIGYHVKLGASGPDTIHVLSHDLDQSVSGDLIHYRLVDGKKPFTANPDLVVPALQSASEIALAVDPTGNVLATARVAAGTVDGAPVARLVARRKQVGGSFTVMPDLADDLSPGDAPGTGAASILFDKAGVPNVLFHYCESATGSQPRFHVFDGSLWSLRKTIDNNSGDGFSGFGARLAVTNDKKVAAFFYRKGLQSNPATADLRLATWSLVSDVPSIEIIAQGLPSGDLMYPRYRVAMAVDVFGLVHLAVVSPTPGTSTGGTLDYIRQVRVDGGGTKWLKDIIDPEALANDQLALVDLVVDEKGRPHIAYRSGKDLKIYYVTRYDR